MPGASIALTGAVDGVNAVFTTAFPIFNEDLYVDRLHQIQGVDYTLVNGTTTATITFLAGAIPPLGALLSLYATPIFGTLPATTSKVGFITAGTIINRCAVQCGLTAVADPFASTDQNFVQLVELLNLVGGDLLSAHDWGQFLRETTIVTAGGATSYVLPADYDRMTDQTQWDRSTRLPIIGPLSSQDAEYLKAKLSGVLVMVAYRLLGNLINFPVAPPDGQTLAFEYVSGNWAWSALGVAPDAETVAASGDTVLYDVDLVIAALRLAYLDAKGFDTTTATERYESRLEHAIGKNSGAPVVTIGGSGVNADHLIDAGNLPPTGYG